MTVHRIKPSRKNKTVCGQWVGQLFPRETATHDPRKVTCPACK